MAHLERRSHLKRGSPPNKPDKLPEDEITPEHLYISRRKFIVGMGAVAATAFLAACARQTPGIPTTPPSFCGDATVASTSDELGDKLTPCNDVTNYNNFYEFSYGKEDVASLSRNFKTSPWMVTVGGLVNNPGSFSVDNLIKKYQPEILAIESLYFFRNFKTAIPVSQACGVVFLTAAKNNIPVFSLTPLQVKMTIAGHGWAEKEKVQKIMKKILGLKEAPKPDDAADALAIALTYFLKNNLLTKSVEKI